ncbi:3010_t:CDS:2 [Dentiscutata heterogama]|uniref:3010_t:CDS:1 n=1 Tax=Dentiscutata heterogama TaxID=1316150 RepID=A0ACA9MWS8_9GLOM|nr:3010_t:CDS:2 [Dentiscutata heterogama]
MHFDGFFLELLVNGQPLKELNIPINEATETAIPKSYVLSGIFKERKYSPNVTYAAIFIPGTRFEVRFASAFAIIDTPIMAFVHVDGSHDYTHHILKQSTSITRDGFWNPSRNKKLFFKFSSATSSTTSSTKSNVNDVCSGLGTVSVYFYKAKRVPRVNHRPHQFEINQKKVAGSKICSEIMYSTIFDEYEERILKGGTNWKRIDKDPIAVLHLHYRPVEWLVSRGLNLSVNERKYLERNKKQKTSVNSNNLAKRPSQVIVISDDEEPSENDVIDLTGSSRKRAKYVSVIEIIDSD